MITALELRGVHAGYGDLAVLHGVDLRVAAGEVVALLGPNGGGKSTTVQVCAGLLRPSAGEVLVAGCPVDGVRPDRLARAGLCTVPEGRGVFPNLSVRDNLQLMAGLGRRPVDVEEVAFGHFPRLAERRAQLAGTLSGGEQQMLAMARALAADPAVLVLDELSMGLAPLVVDDLYEVVGRLAAGGVAMLVVEQFARHVLGVADRAAIMVHGVITRTGTPTEVEAELSAAYLATSKGP